MKNKIKKPVKHQFNNTRGPTSVQSTDDLLFKQDYKNPFAASSHQVRDSSTDTNQSPGNVNLTTEQVENLSVEQIIALSK